MQKKLIFIPTLVLITMAAHAGMPPLMRATYDCNAPALTTEAQEAAEKKARPAMVDAIKRTYPAALESLEESATNVHKKARSRRLLQEYAIKNAIADLPAALTAEEKDAIIADRLQA